MSTSSTAVASSAKSPSEIVHAFWAAFATGRVRTALHDIIASDCEFVMPGMPRLVGHAQIGALFEAYARAFPDFAWSPIHGVEQGDTFAGEARYAGTHRAPLATPQGEIPASGKHVTWQSADIVRVADGKIVSWHVYHDPLVILGQLGVPVG